MLVVGATAPSFLVFVGCLVVTGIGWSIVNPALGKAILDLFSVRERGVAMGIKQTGQTVGGIAAALILPAVAERWGWRLAIGFGGAVVILFLGVGWRPLGGFSSRELRRAEAAVAVSATPRWWHRPALLVLFGSGLGFGMGQSAFLSYLPLFATQALGTSGVGAGGLLALAQAGGAVTRLGLGAASDKWLGSRRTPCLVLTSVLTTGSFLLFAWSPDLTPGLASLIAFCAGAGVLGWVGLYMVLSVEVGGADQVGLMTGVGVAFILAGILLGGPLFGFVLEKGDSYRVAWTLFALLSALIGTTLWAASPAIHRECREKGSP
jgi:sugar phosphate permease